MTHALSKQSKHFSIIVFSINHFFNKDLEWHKIVSHGDFQRKIDETFYNGHTKGELIL